MIVVLQKRTRKAKARKFYIMGPDPRIAGKGGWQMENLQMLLQGRRILGPPADQRGIADFSEPPRLLIDTSLRRVQLDLKLYHNYWLVSDRFKALLAEVDPEGVVIVKCETRNLAGTGNPGYWLCDVVRVLDAVDEQMSRVRIKYDSGDNRKLYSLLGGANLVFKEDTVGPAHIFRMRFSEPNVVCDEELKNACKKAGLKGIAFKDAANY